MTDERRSRTARRAGDGCGAVVQEVGERRAPRGEPPATPAAARRGPASRRARRRPRRPAARRERRDEVGQPVAPVEVDERAEAAETEHDDEVDDRLGGDERRDHEHDRARTPAAETAIRPLPHGCSVVASMASSLGCRRCLRSSSVVVCVALTSPWPTAGSRRAGCGRASVRSRSRASRDARRRQDRAPLRLPPRREALSWESRD